jgi:hypothetical protein
MHACNIRGTVFHGVGKDSPGYNSAKRLNLRIQTILPVSKEFSAIVKLSKEIFNEEDPILRSLVKPIEADLRKSVDEDLLPQLNPKIISVLVLIVIERFDFILAMDKVFS